jgi:hypothetical protein
MPEEQDLFGKSNKTLSISKGIKSPFLLLNQHNSFCIQINIVEPFFSQDLPHILHFQLWPPLPIVPSNM